MYFIGDGISVRFIVEVFLKFNFFLEFKVEDYIWEIVIEFFGNIEEKLFDCVYCIEIELNQVRLVVCVYM